MISVHFQGKPFTSRVIQVCALITNAEEAEAERLYETPILWPPDAKNRLTGKDSDAGKD